MQKSFNRSCHRHVLYIVKAIYYNGDNTFDFQCKSTSWDRFLESLILLESTHFLDFLDTINYIFKTETIVLENSWNDFDE